MKKIYLLRNKLDGMEYIGQTTNSIEERLRNGYKPGTKIREAIDRDGLENFEHEVLEDGLTEEEADEKEQHYIRTRNTLWPNGYNLEGGGKHNSVHSLTKEKISQSKMGVPLSEEHIDSLKEAWKHRSHTQSEETKLKRSNAELNRPDLSRPVRRFTKDGQFIKEYPSACEAQRQTGISQSNITRCCQHKYGFKTAGKSVWEYVSQTELISV